MRSTLDSFLADISEMQVFVDTIARVYETLAEYGDANIRACINIRRRLDYTAFTIAIYAALEKFVDDLAWSYTELESSRNKYSGLCDKLRWKHLRESAVLLSRGNLGEGRYTGVTEIDVVRNLYTCLSGSNPYTLNRHAVVFHDQNLRSDVVQSIFTSLGIENINAQACSIDSMIDWFYSQEGIEEASSTEKVPETKVNLKLNDLVDRRNQVAHGGRDLTESFDANEMQVRLDFLEAYARSLFTVLANAYLDRYYIKSGVATSLGYPVEGPFKGGSVVVVCKPTCRVFRGQPIVGVREGRVVRWGEVLEIQVEDVFVENVDPDSGCTSIGLRADFKLTKGIELYALEKKDELIWN